MQPGLGISQLLKLTKPLSDKAVIGGSQWYKQRAYVNGHAWGNDTIMFYEEAPKIVNDVDENQVRHVTDEQMAYLENSCTIPVWPRELRIYDNGRLTGRYVGLESADGQTIYLNGTHLGAILKRAGKKCEDVSYLAYFPSAISNATPMVLVQNGRKLGITAACHPEKEESFDSPDATFRYAGDLPKPSATKLDRFRNAHEKYRYIVTDGQPTPTIQIIEDDWTSERCVYAGPVNGSKSARQWLDT